MAAKSGAVAGGRPRPAPHLFLSYLASLFPLQHPQPI
jgi:hypothetical protein